MSRLSIAGLVLAFAAFALGVGGPALDPAVLKEQLAFAERVTEKSGAPPTQEAGERGFKEEATRWLTRKIRERNDRDDGQAAQPAAAPGVFVGVAPYVVPATMLIAVAAIGLAVADWLRTRALRPNLTAALVAGAAIVLPFAWSAVAIGVTVAAIMIAIFLVGSALG